MALEHLNAKEKALYIVWQEDRKKPSLATALSVKLFELFLHGVDCAEIVSINRGSYSIEQILEARVRDRWDERRNEYLETLFNGVVGRFSQAQAESISFLTDLLASAHKMHGIKLKAYLQTGNEEDLGDFRINGWQNYKGVVDALMKLTGQDKVPSPRPTLHEDGLEPEAKAVRALPAGGVRVLDASDAAKILGVLTDE